MAYKDRFRRSASERGRMGAEARWGPSRRVHLGDLTPEQRNIVHALIDAQRAANAVAEGRDPKDGDR